LLAFPQIHCFAQTLAQATATLREVHADGMKTIAEAQIVSLTKLLPGTQVARVDLQAAADQLIQTGLFSKVNYNFQTRTDGVGVIFHLEESPRVPVYFDNIPWFSDAELVDAIRKTLPFFDGTLPAAGSVVDQTAVAVNNFLTAHGLRVTVEHQAQPNPLGEGSVQAFQIVGAALHIAKLEFSDPSLASSRVIQAHLSEILGKPYSRLAIELFLSESVRPVFLQKGLLRAKLGPPEVRLTGNPNQKLPEQIPIYVPVASGPVYHWKGAEWSGNRALSTFTLAGALGLNPGDVADGMAIEGGWDRAREEYGHRGFLEARIDPQPSYDEQAHTVSYSAKVQEGPQFHFREFVFTGISLNGERRIRETWPIPPGEIFDKSQFEEYLITLQSHAARIFGDLPIHYDSVGHWLRTDAAKGTVDVLLDFK
ncbi:MAG: POTRA domain-containing protein, partial [Candidatus Acidiferrum sp.]